MVLDKEGMRIDYRQAPGSSLDDWVVSKGWTMRCFCTATQILVDQPEARRRFLDKVSFF